MKYIEIYLQKCLDFGSCDGMKTKMKTLNAKRIENRVWTEKAYLTL